ncbi:MAG: hypothetical protein ACRDQU_03260 [Pseudonocardiaceae bacterium]
MLGISVQTSEARLSGLGRAELRSRGVCCGKVNYQPGPSRESMSATSSPTSPTWRDERDTLAGANLNTMTTVAALGFDDIPPQAFAVAYNLISIPGLLAPTIKEGFVAKRDWSGFSSLIRRTFNERVIRPLAKER